MTTCGEDLVRRGRGCALLGLSNTAQERLQLEGLSALLPPLAVWSPNFITLSISFLSCLMGIITGLIESNRKNEIYGVQGTFLAESKGKHDLQQIKQ